MFGNISSITTPIIIGYIIQETGSFNGALVFVGANALRGDPELSGHRSRDQAAWNCAARLCPHSFRRSDYARYTHAAAGSGARRASPPSRCPVVTRPSLRSARWFGPADLRSFGHRSRAMQMGYAPEEWTGKPVIAIINTWSDLQPCHAHFKTAGRGREARHPDGRRLPGRAAGAVGVSESFVKPTTMMYRNMLAMETEELLRSHPVDGAVLMGGCDKTTPGLLLGATSMNIPAIFLPAGPMLRGNWQGKVLGSGTR